MSQRISHRPSMRSMATSTHIRTRPRPTRNCSNCVCSPGLLSRHNRASSVIANRMKLRRSSTSGQLSRTSTKTGLVDCKKQEEINTSSRLKALRSSMVEAGVNIYIIGDEKRRSFISGFDGASGTVLVTVDPTSLNDVPDGISVVNTELIEQAEAELDFNWSLLEGSWQQWAVSTAAQMSLDSGKLIKIGINPKHISFLDYQVLEDFRAAALLKHEGKKFTPKVEIFPVERDLVDSIWSEFEDIDGLNLSEVSVLPEKYAGEAATFKLKRVRNEMKSLSAGEDLVISALDEIAWLLNLRGSDILFAPVFLSQLIISGDGTACLYVDKSRLTSSVCKYLAEIGVSVKSYTDFYTDLESKPTLAITKDAKWDVVLHSKKHKLIESPVSSFKSIKNEVEIKNCEIAQLKDGLANIRYYAWLEKQLVGKEEFLTEHEVLAKQENLHKNQENFVGLALDPMSASGKHSVGFKYVPPKEGSTIIDPRKIYVNGFGAHYLEGTTDLTRSTHFRDAKLEEKQIYTLILKGYLALERLNFSKGTSGAMVEAFVKQFLWSNHIDYSGATGHGVGSYLNVDEDNIGIGSQYNSELQPGNVFSIEPGFSTEESGVKIGNIAVVKEDKGFLKFNTLTKVPYCRKLISMDMLTVEEIGQINSYHQSIWETYKNTLEELGDKDTLKWLKRACGML